MISLERKHPLAECEDCPLLENRFCPSSGPKDAKVAFVSRSPGKHDVIAKRPFAGPSGRVLDNLLRRHGVNRGDVLTTNVVLCQSDDPPLAAIKACNPVLKQRSPTVILSLRVEPKQPEHSPSTKLSRQDEASQLLGQILDEEHRNGLL
jgi:hypothetical protein